ncbi:MAG TPA: hypothetical protein VK705_10375 [Ferruginibacter sp.]|jgi:hypothetical protein|nr:hypothetical protein [Ferruginibacter sp.]
MKNYILSFLLLSMISFNSFAQKENINDFSNKLLCNAYVYGKTDTATFNFLQDHFPYLTRPKPEDGLITPPEGTNSKHSIVSMTFKKHPFFDFKFKEAHLDFFTVDGIFEKGAQLSLIFDNEGDEDYVFSQLSNSLQNLSYQKTVTNKPGEQSIIYTAYINGSIYKPELDLLKDDANKSYKILFKREFDEGTGF